MDASRLSQIAEEDRQRFLTLIRHWHEGHPRKDQVEHCVNVSRYLGQALDQETGQVQGRRAMILAALGHDLYEDSKIDPAQVAAEYGPETDKLIEGMTERNGVTEYVERVAAGPEEVRLIKLCDLIDNYDGILRNRLLWEDPTKWVEVVRKHMEPMFNRLAAIPFHHYAAAGRWLGEELNTKRERFRAEVGKITSVGTETVIYLNKETEEKTE